MAEYEPKPRQCVQCEYLLKKEEKRCPKCYPVNPHLRKQDKKQEVSTKTDPWFCADCSHKFGPEFQECPVCRAKTHVFCDDCGSLHSKKEPCPICNDESDFPPREGDDILEVQIPSEEESPQRAVTKEDEREIETLLTKSKEIPLEKEAIWNPNKHKPWSAERKAAYAEKRRRGEIGRPKKQTQTEAKKEALTKVHAAKKIGDGRKNNHPNGRPRKKQKSPEPLEAAPEKPLQAILKLDLDGKNGLNQLCDRLWIIKYLGLKVETVEIYHTVNGFHAVLKCDNIFKSWEILLFQTWLGSDFRREMCNLLKIERGTENWNHLFKEKWKYNVLGEEIRVSQEKFDTELSQKVLRLIQLGD